MRPLRPGQDTVLSWSAGAVECRVVAAAGHFVLLRPERTDVVPAGECSLTYLDGMVPTGWDGSVENGGHPGELRFRVRDHEAAADRRSAVRVPVVAEVSITTADAVSCEGQLLDVSAGGMRFRQPGRLPAGSLVRVRANLPDGIVVDADAVVRNSEQGITAVEFTRMHASDSQTVGGWTVGVLRSSLPGQG